MSTILGRVRKSIVRVFIAVMVVQLTTFGCAPAKKYAISPAEVDQQRVQRLMAIIDTLAVGIGVRTYARYTNLQRAQRYITQAFRDLGYEVDEVKYEIEGVEFANIVAERASPDRAEDLVIIGAHYDSCFNPGADDNASGVAGLIELARMLKDEKTASKIRFVAFVNEEPPFFTTENMGSLVYVRSIKARGEKVKAAVILEMIGYYSEKPFSQRYLPMLGFFYPNRGNFIAVVGNFRSRRVVSHLVKSFKQASPFPIESLVAPQSIPGIYFSDHWSFWKEGYPAVMVTDTAYLRNKHYHEQTDLPDTLDYEKMAVMLAGLKEAIVSLAKKE